MAELSRGEKRTQVILRAKLAFKKGVSASKFIENMRVRGLSYRRTDMLADFRSVNELEVKADRLKYVRKDRVPTAAVIAQVDWELSREFMFKVKIRSRIAPGEPITERFVNIMSDRPLTPGIVEGLVWSLIGEQSPKLASQVISVTPWTAIQRILQ